MGFTTNDFFLERAIKSGVSIDFEADQRGSVLEVIFGKLGKERLDQLLLGDAGQVQLLWAGDLLVHHHPLSKGLGCRERGRHFEVGVPVLLLLLRGLQSDRDWGRHVHGFDQLVVVLGLDWSWSSL